MSHRIIQSQGVSPALALRALRRQTGAALIAVMLLTMVLSAVGLVAMQNTFDSLRLTGTYRMSRQAFETANTVLEFSSVREGDRALALSNRLSASNNLDAASAATPSERAQVIESGGSVSKGMTAYIGEAILNDSGTGESGLFNDNGGAQRSNDSDQAMGNVDFEIIIRDPINGPPPRGSQSSLFCSKLLFIGSRAVYNNLQLDSGGKQSAKNWERPPRNAAAMLGQESILENVPCNGSGTR